MIVIVDYGLGNLGSIANMLKVIGEKTMIADDPEVMLHSDGIILPGVGAFDAGMQRLQETDLAQTIIKCASTGMPILGICLGMQLLGKKSEEGHLPGLGLIPFECRRFAFSEECDLKIPHMGWDVVRMKQSHMLVNGLMGIQRFYFVHSYHAVCDDARNVLMT